MLAHCGILRERVLRVCEVAFGHRLMMDMITPGGVVKDLSDDSAYAIGELIETLRDAFPNLVTLYDNTASLQDRTVRTGVLSNVLAMQYGCGGFIGRASGRDFDARRAYPYAPYDHLTFDVPRRIEGDVNARLWIRVHEIEQSLDILEQVLARMPKGPCRVDMPERIGEGHALVEGFRGDVFVALRLNDDGTIANAHARDPSWFQWPLLEAAIEGNIVADFPIINKSFNCSYSGHDI